VSAREDWLWVFIASVAASLLHLGGNARLEKAGIGPAGEIAALGSWWPAWRLERASGQHVHVRRGQGGGRVVLAGSLGSTWPRTRRGRGPPAAYGRATAEQRGEREQGLVCEF
jgi:hypothetical protein